MKIIWIILAIAIGIGVFLLFNINFISNNSSNQIEEDVNISAYAKNCKMYYGGVKSTIKTYGGSDICHKVYQSALAGNSEICKEISSEIDKAICLGVSVSEWEDQHACDQLLDEQNKQICILNALKKIHILSDISSLKDLNFCDNFSNETLKSICQNYYNLVNSDYSSCFLENSSFDNYCIGGALYLTSDKQVIKNICESLFEKNSDLISCYLSARNDVINYSRLPPIYIENISWEISGEIYPSAHHEIQSSEIGIDIPYRYIVTHTAYGGGNNPDYDIIYSPIKYLPPSILKEYSCPELISTIAQLDQCIPYFQYERRLYLFKQDQIKYKSWNYYGDAY